jgi:hypothetical protein
LLHPGDAAEEKEREPAHAVAWLEAEEQRGSPEAGQPVVEVAAAPREPQFPLANAVPEAAQDGAATVASPRGVLRRTAAFLNVNGLARASLLAVLIVAVGISAAACATTITLITPEIDLGLIGVLPGVADPHAVAAAHRRAVHRRDRRRRHRRGRPGAAALMRNRAAS